MFPNPNFPMANQQPAHLGGRPTHNYVERMQHRRSYNQANFGSKQGGMQSPAGMTPEELQAVQRDGELTIDTIPSPIYISGLFDICSDRDIMSLSLQGTDQFLDWLGWEPSGVNKMVKNFIAWQRPDYSGGNPTAGGIADACAVPNTVDWGYCDFVLENFGRFRRRSLVRDDTNDGIRFCEQQPRYRIDGSLITSEAEWDMVITTEVLIQDIRLAVVEGLDTDPGGFDGLEALVNYTYTDSAGVRCQMMDSIVIDWNGNEVGGGAGITWNGDAVDDIWNLIDVLRSAYRQIRTRISWAPQLANQTLQTGDMVLLMPSWAVSPFLDAFAAWSLADGTQFNEVNFNALDLRTFRTSLDGGMFGAGQVMLEGFVIPIMPYDWGTIKSDTRVDMYLLTGSIGNQKLLHGQFKNMDLTNNSDGRYEITDGGRLLTYIVSDETCSSRRVEIQPRIVSWAPWANVRIQDVRFDAANPVISPDPNTSWYPQKSFVSAGE